MPPGVMEWVYSKDAARGTVLALDAKDLGSGVFNLTMGAMTTPNEFAAAIGAVVPGAKVKFEAPAGTGVSLSNRFCLPQGPDSVHRICGQLCGRNRPSARQAAPALDVKRCAARLGSRQQSFPASLAHPSRCALRN